MPHWSSDRGGVRFRPRRGLTQPGPSMTVRTRIELPSRGVLLVGDRWQADAPRGIVVLLHGGGQTRHSWDATAERLAVAGWTAITYDARGHGDSQWHPGGEYSLDAFVGDLLALVSTLEEQPCWSAPRSAG